MAYIIQQRRDIAENWSKVNPVLARGEMGFIEDVDENGVQKSSLYKMGDGRTDWNHLPLFGFGGNVYNTANAWKGSDLDTTVASQQAILDKITEKIAASEEVTNNTIDELNANLSQAIYDVVNGVEGENPVEGLVDKVSLTQLVQDIYERENEFPEEATEEEKSAILAAQIVSRVVIMAEFAGVWEKIENNEGRIEALEDTTDDHESRIANAEALISSHTDEITGIKSSNESKFAEVDSNIEEHEKFISGWTEFVEKEPTEPEGEPTIEEVYHKGVDEKIADVDAKITALDTKMTNMHNVVSEVEFAALDKSGYPDGTLFFTYKVE